ncbi:MAG: nuclear transport factor 2 family protein [Mycobacterium sp.]|nr:nuclear transport factor 2 family protein [Mycobacterium sp.]
MDVRISNLERDGENRPFASNGTAFLGTAGGFTVMKGVFQPGWRWSKDVGPIAGTKSCQTRHLGYVLSGHMQGKLDDGTEFDVVAGDMFDLPAGHDAWVVGEQATEVLDYSAEAAGFAQVRAEEAADPNDTAMNAIRKGYVAFNAGDVETLASLMSRDVVQHVVGSGSLTGDHKGIESVLRYYAQLGEMTDGTFRADLLEVHGDHHGHALSVHQISATRNGVTRVSRGSILFTFVGDKVTDMLELRSDLPGDDAFLS